MQLRNNLTNVSFTINIYHIEALGRDDSHSSLSSVDRVFVYAMSLLQSTLCAM